MSKRGVSSRWALLGMMVLVMLLVTACAETDDPAKAVVDYFQAKVEGDAEKLGSLLCAELESILPREANSFASAEASLQDVSCEATDTNGDIALVTCEGYIFVDYGEEESELPLSTYRVVKEDGEWKWCGETE